MTTQLLGILLCTRRGIACAVQPKGSLVVSAKEGFPGPCCKVQTPAQALSRALAWSLQTPAVLPRIPTRGSRSSRWWRNVARSPAAVGYRSRSIAASKPFSAGQSVYSPIAGHGDRVLAAVFFDNSYPLFPPPFPPFLRSLLLPTTALVATRAPCEDGKEVRRGGR